MYMRQLAGRLRAPVQHRIDASAALRLGPTRFRFAVASASSPQRRHASSFGGPEPHRRRKAVPVFENPRDDPRLRDAKPIVTPQQIRRFYKSPSLYSVVAVSFLAAIVFYVSNLETVPVSGRRRFNCHSEESIRKLSEQQFQVLMREFQEEGVRFLPGWDARTRMVRRVMERLKPVSGMEDLDWEFFVIDDPATANAFVLPCGKIFVFSGIFRQARSEDAVASLLGHEIAHTLANHEAEKISANIGTTILFWSLAILSFGALTLPMTLGGWLGSKVLFEMPMSRMQETEADQIGLLMMAEACYDPREALTLWRNMDLTSGDQEPPEWLSTHPSHKSRIERLKKMIPLAMEKREQSDCQGTQGFAELFKQALRRGEVIAIYANS